MSIYHDKVIVVANVSGRTLLSVVPAGGIEPTGQVEITQVTDSIKRQKRQNRQKRVSRLRGGYAEHCKGF